MRPHSQQQFIPIDQQICFFNGRGLVVADHIAITNLDAVLLFAHDDESGVDGARLFQNGNKLVCRFLVAVVNQQKLIASDGGFDSKRAKIRRGQ